MGEPRGTSVVDYMLVPRYILKQCKGFNVTSCSKIVEEHNYFPLLNERSEISDHTILTLLFEIRTFSDSDYKSKIIPEPQIRYNLKIF